MSLLLKFRCVRSACPETSLPAGILPLDLLARVLQTAGQQLRSHDQQLAQLVRLACVSRTWQTAAGACLECQADMTTSPEMNCLWKQDMWPGKSPAPGCRAAT